MLDSLVSREVTVVPESSVSEPALFAVKCRCKSQFCKDCALSHCVKWREKLRPALKEWKSVIMLTMTVDPKSFDSPEEAYRAVGKKRSVSELVRKLFKRGMVESKRFTVTIEFHKSGWPHYHLLVESSFVEKHELQRIWGHGLCWVSSVKFQNVDHAINYATKYITKTSKEGDEFEFPEWVLDFKGNMRRFSTSRGLCGEVKKRPVKGEGSKRVRIRKTARQRTENCGKATTILSVTEKLTEGKIDGKVCGMVERSTKFVATLEIDWVPEMADLKEFEIRRLLNQHRTKQICERPGFRVNDSTMSGQVRFLTLALAMFHPSSCYLESCHKDDRKWLEQQDRILPERMERQQTNEAQSRLKL